MALELLKVPSTSLLEKGQPVVSLKLPSSSLLEVGMWVASVSISLWEHVNLLAGSLATALILDMIQASCPCLHWRCPLGIHSSQGLVSAIGFLRSHLSGVSRSNSYQRPKILSCFAQPHKTGPQVSRLHRPGSVSAAANHIPHSFIVPYISLCNQGACQVARNHMQPVVIIALLSAQQRFSGCAAA